ncbi:MAG: HPF/RaiA family ribosome-associated protein [Hyphomicrobiaceae bacterium]
MRAHIAGRIDEVVEKYPGLEIGGRVVVEKERGRFLTHCSLSLRSGLSLRSSAEAEDAYVSADGAIERLEKRMRRYKRRLKNHHAHADGRSAGELEAVDHLIGESPDTESEGGDGDHTPVIIAEEKSSIGTMAVATAVMSLDLSDEPVLVFRHATHGRINIVYRRRDGHIGWIDPRGEEAG